MPVSHNTPFATKGLKLILNIIVVVLYRVGDGGYFMGASYHKNHDAETLTTGIFIGFLIYNIVGLVAMFFDKYTNSSITETIMNIIGAIMWITTGAVIIQFWNRFLPENHFNVRDTNPKPAGLAMGSLAVINSIVYAGEAIITAINYNNSDEDD